MADPVFLTGASGFVGSHILRELRAAGYPVRAIVRPGQPTAAIPSQLMATLFLCHPEPFDSLRSLRTGEVEGPPPDIITGDLRRPGDFARALDGCRYVVHAAALYSFAPRDRADIHAVNVEGTASLMVAAHLAGVERVILTSSSATIGHAHADRWADERDYPPIGGQHDAYHHSKLEQERAAFAGRVPVVAVLPTAPVGPGDWKPTPTGKLVLDFARGKIAAKAPGGGGMNLVAVEDVARAHVAALKRGRPGERYVVGGENLSMDSLWELLAEISGKPMPKWRAPYTLALAAAYVDEVRCRMNPNAAPAVPLEGVRMSRKRMYADSSKARRELNHQPTPVRAALGRALTWYRENGYLAT